MAVMGEGQSETISNWRGSAVDLVIRVDEVNTVAIPNYATLEITLQPQTAPSPTQRLATPTSSPSKPPITSSPTSSPSKPPITSWPTTEPTLSPSMKPSRKPTGSPTMEPTATPTSSPSIEPVDLPSNEPTAVPTSLPSQSPIYEEPTHSPSAETRTKLTGSPSKEPTVVPIYPSTKPMLTESPTQKPTASEIVYFDSGVAGSASWSGPIIGTNHFGNNPAGLPIVIMLVSGEEGVTWFVGFNHRHVTITKGAGGKYSLMGMLVTQQKETIANWRNSGFDLEIKVHKINENVVPASADIEITFGADVPTLSMALTKHPTSSPTYSPTDLPSTCGNFVCDADENPETCPTDCGEMILKPNSIGNSESRGQMFTVDAKTNHVTITSFDVAGIENGNTMCSVFTRAGEYQGHEEDSSGWELIFEKRVSLKQGVPTTLGALYREVTILSGSRQAFYIVCKAGFLHKQGKTEGAPYYSDNGLIINEGVATKKLFQKVSDKLQYGGWIRYVYQQSAHRQLGK